MSVKTLIENPTEFDFYKAVFLLQQQIATSKSQHNKVGYDSLPKNELVRFKVDQHLGFPGQSISKIEAKKTNDQEQISVDMNVSFMGLTGASGVLPQHYSELVLARLKMKDTGMRDFYDLFNHRLISLFYRAWEKYRFAINYQKDQQLATDSYTEVLDQLSGNESIMKYYAGIFNKSIRTIDGLTQLIEDFTQCEVSIKQFQGQWHKLAPTDRTRLGGRKTPEGQYASLGKDATIGSKVWDINSAIGIVLKPKSYQSMQLLLPSETENKLLKKLIRKYLGSTIKYKMQLEVKEPDIPKVQLSKHAIPLGLGCGLVTRESNKQKIYLLPL
ncbi:type VI secretion system baseplate subunit TssG [Colwellia sp. KU-HH00111]|uniref:type VI secretion system baseplate subunit TssG n=1 Tax=Colwellia sp. KU-HH00111 TaxID=3127652 RepID=UPI0031020F47